MNAQTNLRLYDPERQATIDTLVEKATSDGYFTTTGAFLSDDEDLEEVARRAYYGWCESHDRASIEYDEEECIVSCSHDRPLTSSAVAQLQKLAVGFDDRIDDPGDGSHFFQVDLFRGAGSDSALAIPELDFLAQLTSIMNDPRSFCPGQN